MSALPRGIWWETSRNRFRVRVYRKARVIHLSYHDDVFNAVASLGRAKRFQRYLRANDKRGTTTNGVELLSKGLV